jgi:DNA polymerase II large subunit
MSKGYQNYIETMEKQLQQLYTISETARSKGLDPALKTECIIAKDIADLVEGLVGPKEVAVSIR